MRRLNPSHHAQFAQVAAYTADWLLLCIYFPLFLLPFSFCLCVISASHPTHQGEAELANAWPRVAGNSSWPNPSPRCPITQLCPFHHGGGTTPALRSAARRCVIGIFHVLVTAQCLDLATSGAAAVRTPTSSPAKTWRNRDCPAPSCCPADAGLALRKQAEGKQRRRDTGQPRPADTRTLPPLIRPSSSGRARVRRSAQTSARHFGPITMRLVHPHPAAASREAA